MSNDPFEMIIDRVATKLTQDLITEISDTDASKVSLIEKYDFSGDPTKPGVSANKVVIRPDPEIQEHRGVRVHSSAIGSGPRTWEYHIEIEVEAFTVRITKDRAEVRDIVTKIIGRILNALEELATEAAGTKTTDAHWEIVHAADPYIQGGGYRIKDAGRTKSIKGNQSLIVGFILQYRR